VSAAAEPVTESAARRFLAKAFERAQAAQSRGDSEPATLPLTKAQSPEFFAMRNLDDARQFRAELALAERQGAIRIVPAKRMAPPKDVKAIVVADIEALATRLGLDVRADLVARARSQLLSHLDMFPVLNQVLERWQTGKTVRGTSPTSSTVRALLDAISVRQMRQGREDEVLLRRESSRLFRDSKRIEKLGRWLDLLAEGTLTPSGLAKAEIFSALGLHKEPQPFLIASEHAAVTSRNVESKLFRPYVGLPMTGIEAFRFDASPACVVTVENKATFHEMGLLAAGSGACVIFSGGMPSPAWKQVYAKVLHAIDERVPLYHFGDLDVGGFRIASCIAEVVRERGRTLRPWLMDPVQLTLQGYRLDPAKAAQIKLMQRHCERLGWTHVFEGLTKVPGLLEQEHITPSVPSN
jgi:Wadjet protein JetD, C-terminal